MKAQRGSIAVILLAILALLAIGGGAYYEVQQKAASQAPLVTEQVAPPSDTKNTQTAAQSQPAAGSGYGTGEGPTASPLSGAAPLGVSFGIDSKSGEDNYVVNFGDGSSMSTSDFACGLEYCSVIHTYKAPGSYAVSYKDPAGKTIRSFTIAVTGATQSSISIPGMSKYTDPDFGFSFWYPSGWQITQVSANVSYGGSAPSKRLRLQDPMVKNFERYFDMDEIYSADRSITTREMGSMGCKNIYSYDTTRHQWITSGANCGSSPSDVHLADISVNTMGGLHILGIDNPIVPLSAHNFVSVAYDGQTTSAQPLMPDATFLAKTIVASDPSVAIPVSAAEQIKAIQAERQAYADSPYKIHIDSISPTSGPPGTVVTLRGSFDDAALNVDFYCSEIDTNPDSPACLASTPARNSPINDINVSSSTIVFKVDDQALPDRYNVSLYDITNTNPDGSAVGSDNDSEFTVTK